MTREKNWDPVIAVNLTSAFNTCNVILPGMTERKWGRIINISSMNGQRGQFGQCNYSATKAGIIGLSRSLAMECARAGVTVNVICPGFILTEMTGAMPKEILDAEVQKIPVQRIGQPDDIAYAVVILASRRCELHHRPDDLGQRRPSDAVTNGYRRSRLRFASQAA